LLDIKRAGEYIAAVYCGDDLINELKIIVQNESGQKNSVFDELF
jgi:hypothetical protein